LNTFEKKAISRVSGYELENSSMFDNS